MRARGTSGCWRRYRGHSAVLNGHPPGHLRHAESSTTSGEANANHHRGTHRCCPHKRARTGRSSLSLRENLRRTRRRVPHQEVQQCRSGSTIVLPSRRSAISPFHWRSMGYLGSQGRRWHRLVEASDRREAEQSRERAALRQGPYDAVETESLRRNRRWS